MNCAPTCTLSTHLSRLPTPLHSSYEKLGINEQYCIKSLPYYPVTAAAASTAVAIAVAAAVVAVAVAVATVAGAASAPVLQG